MTDKEQKFCKDCTYYHSEDFYLFSCRIPTEYFDPVTGENILQLKNADYNRRKNSQFSIQLHCGPDGKYWTSKDVSNKTPVKAPKSLVQRLYKVFGTWVAKTLSARQ